ncbi:hypothetical protein P3W45_000915 [Vairimorpha bombi]
MSRIEKHHLISSRRKENVASFVKKVHEDLKIRKIERFNRKLHDLIYKNNEDKLLSVRVKRAIEVYNNSFHTEIQMTPNTEIIKEIQMANIIKFNEKHKHKSRGDVVMIREKVAAKKEVKNLRKGDVLLKRVGLPNKAYENISYLTDCVGKIFKRHANQLKLVIDEIS